MTTPQPATPLARATRVFQLFLDILAGFATGAVLPALAVGILFSPQAHLSRNGLQAAVLGQFAFQALIVGYAIGAFDAPQEDRHFRPSPFCVALVAGIFTFAYFFVVGPYQSIVIK